MNLYQCEEAAKNVVQMDGKPELTFLWTGNGRVAKMKWLDPYMGLAQVENVPGFVTTRDLDAFCPNAVCTPTWETK